MAEIHENADLFQVYRRLSAEREAEVALRAYLSGLAYRIISEELANPIGLFKLV